MAQGPTVLMVTLIEKNNPDAKPFSAHPVDAREHLKSGEFEVVNGGKYVGSIHPEKTKDAPVEAEVLGTGEGEGTVAGVTDEVASQDA